MISVTQTCYPVLFGFIACNNNNHLKLKEKNNDLINIFTQFSKYNYTYNDYDYNQMIIDKNYLNSHGMNSCFLYYKNEKEWPKIGDIFMFKYEMNKVICHIYKNNTLIQTWDYTNGITNYVTHVIAGVAHSKIQII